MLGRDSHELQPVKEAALPFDPRAGAVARTATAIAVLFLAAWVAHDFLAALTWAAVIAVAAWPIYIRFATRTIGGRSSALAALLFTLLTGLVLLVPIVLSVHQISPGRHALA